jgi:hypothetical protein
MLENRNTNITTQLACYSPEFTKDIIKAFSDLRLALVLGEAEG